MGSIILFDLDGTLTDPKEGIANCLSHALERMGMQPPDPTTLGWCIGPPIQDSIWLLLGTDEEEPNGTCLAHFRERFSTTGMFENRVYDGIPDALSQLKGKGHRLLVATSKPTVFATQILDHFKLSQFFDGVYGSELDGELSNKADLIAHVLKAEDLDPQTTIMIGDREHDVLGAKANKMRSLGVLYGYGTPEELKKAGATSLCERPVDLVEAVNNLLDS